MTETRDPPRRFRFSACFRGSPDSITFTRDTKDEAEAARKEFITLWSGQEQAEEP